MAQWQGQFSGNTHQSKVCERELVLRHAIEVYRSRETQPERDAQAKIAIRIADQLLRGCQKTAAASWENRGITYSAPVFCQPLKARVRAAKAQLAAMDPRERYSRAATGTETKIQKMVDDGSRRILDEFDALDIVEN